MDIYNAGSRVMNTYIYHTVNGYIMIDTGYEHSMKNVEKRANKQGIAFSEIKYILALWICTYIFTALTVPR